MTWYAWPDSQGFGAGDVDSGPPWTQELDATGMHGYATQAEADAKRNAPLNGIQQMVVQQVKASQAIVGGPQGSTEGSLLTLGGATQDATKAATQTATSALGGLGNWLGQSNLWLRVTEMILGAALIITGLARLTGSPGLKAVATAVKLAK